MSETPIETVLVFDTETTGLPNFRLPPSDPSQPDIVQLAARLYYADGRPIAGFSTIVCPDALKAGTASIPDKVAAIHGITDDIALRFGITPDLALRQFNALLGRADLLVAHNISFDELLMRIAVARGHYPPMPDEPATYCTMEAAKPIVNCPPTPKMVRAGFTGPKAPRLEECIKHFFDEELVGAHDALVDVDACARVYFHLQSLIQPAGEPA